MHQSSRKSQMYSIYSSMHIQRCTYWCKCYVNSSAPLKCTCWPSQAIRNCPIKQTFAYLGWSGWIEGLHWVSVGLPNPHSHHLRRKNRRRKTESEPGGPGSEAWSRAPAAAQHPLLQSARCETWGPPASCLHTDPPHPSSCGPSGPLWLQKGSAPLGSTFYADPCLDGEPLSLGPGPAEK